MCRRSLHGIDLFPCRLQLTLQALLFFLVVCAGFQCRLVTLRQRLKLSPPALELLLKLRSTALVLACTPIGFCYPTC